MGRYRAPQAKSSPYITPVGFARLHREQKMLWRRRQHVTKAVTAAAAEGDRSENAEYIYRKKELREIDRRIRYLQKRLPDLVVVERQPSSDAVYFGAQVELEAEQQAAPGAAKTAQPSAASQSSSQPTIMQTRVRLVGSDEIDPSRRHISIDSPLARALLKRQVDDEVEVTVDGRKIFYTVLSIAYPEEVLPDDSEADDADQEFT